MFVRVYTLSFFLFFVLPLLVRATAVARRGHGGSGGSSPSNQCNTGTISCCNSVGSASSLGLTGILGLLGIVLDPITAILGLDCSPISVIGVAGNSCSAQPVCCTGNQFNGLINIGCTPININL
ncbi:hypothetical protein GALMADRAFT_153891 [Galerina marginata CBS 339.88]|uniref:Hydrophobin n=1 Tax=Galerina marginata (strain CBS 339.88) TaxID=685588 RepID=A0A067TAI3_GALM3|nr:hypothetical protein GALMADRAFT_153891 [Galerina marginata CBS 339.88]